MQTDTITLRELTIRYSVKADATGQPVVIGRTLSTPAASAAALSALLQDEPGNHPSGDPTPSPDDHHLTRRLVDAGKLIGVEVLDHIIVGDGRYYSFKEGSCL